MYAFFVQPRTNTGRNIFLEPFHPNLWFSLLSLQIFLILSIRIISFFAKERIGLEREDEILTNQITLWTWSTICQQGFHAPPKLTCLRIALITWVLTSLIVYVSYSAKLVSMFSLQILPIKNFEDLVNSKINLAIDLNNARARAMLEVRVLNLPLIAFELILPLSVGYGSRPTFTPSYKSCSETK